MSLRWQIAVGLALIAALVSTVSGIAAYAAAERQVNIQLDTTLTAIGREVNNDGPQVTGGFGAFRGSDPGAGGGRDAGGRRPPFTRDERSCPLAGDLGSVSVAQLINLSGEVLPCLAGARDLPVDERTRAIAQGRSSASWIRTVAVDGRSYRVLSIPWHHGGALQLARDLAEADRVLAGLRRRYLLLGMAGIATAAGLGWLVARRIVRPLERLRDVASEIADTQDLAVAVPVGGTGEIRSLGLSLTTMVDALAASRDQQSRLIHDAGHELRTPLTSLRTNVEFLRKADALPVEQRHEVLDAVTAELGELTNLVTELVELTTDASAPDEPSDEVDMAELADAVAARARRRSGRDVTVHRAPAAQVSVTARPLMVERAISNLVDNALKYSGSGEVEIAVAAGRIEVLDRGPGFAAQDLPHVFERFYRAPSARTAPGSGLGLAIVANITARHGGRFWAHNRSGGGAAVGFELPSAEDSTQAAARGAD